MRRKDREITDREEILAVMHACDVCRIALNDTDGIPYIVPLNFGMETCEDGTIRLYFHSAAEGKKLDLIGRDPRAAFEMDCRHELKYDADRCRCTMYYASVEGRGRIHILSEEEKVAALEMLMAHYYPGTDQVPFNPAAIPRTCVYCLTVEEISGKTNIK